jgi:hypothetical protein
MQSVTFNAGAKGSSKDHSTDIELQSTEEQSSKLERRTMLGTVLPS